MKNKWVISFKDGSFWSNGWGVSFAAAYRFTSLKEAEKEAQNYYNILSIIKEEDYIEPSVRLTNDLISLVNEAVDCGFKLELAYEAAQKNIHNYQYWGNEEWDPIQEARNKLSACLDKLKSITHSSK